MRFVFYLAAVVCWRTYVIADIPGCSFLDTVRVKEEDKLPNGSYTYQDAVIPSHLVGDYDYVDFGERTTVKLHTRACVCKLKPCIRRCCKIWRTDGNGTCDTKLEDTGEIALLPVKWANGSMGTLDVAQDRRFFYIPWKMSRTSAGTDWHRLENGLLEYRTERGVTQLESKEHYCILLARSEGDDSPLVYKAFLELIVNEHVIIFGVTGYIMIVSVVLMCLVIVNLVSDHKTWKWLHQLQLSYLLCLTLTFSIMSSIILSAEPPQWCGFVMYYLSLGAFMFLTIISCKLLVNAWQTSRAKTMSETHVGWLLLLGCGVPLAPTAVLVYLQYYSGGGDIPFPTRSWFDELGWHICYYFYVPIGVLLSFNALCFLGTSYIIYRTRSGVRAASNTQRNNFVLFVKLFLTMGVTWGLDVIAYALSEETLLKHISSIVGAAQGVLIFSIFLMDKYRVIKRKRKGVACNWLNLCRRSECDSTRNSMETQCPRDSTHSSRSASSRA